MPSAPLAVLFTLAWLPIFAFRAEAISEALPSYGGSERFWVIAAPLIVAVHVAASCLLLSLGAPVPVSRAVVAFVLAVGGVAFWLWARHAIGPVRVRRLPDQLPMQLRSDGPFGVVRNPLYFGVLLVAAAPALAAGRPLLAASFAACFVALGVRAAQEERRLHQQLGEAYAQYCRRVSRLVPWVW